MVLSLYSLAIENTFPLSNFETKHIFGSNFLFSFFFITTGSSGFRHSEWGTPGTPNFFSFVLPPPKAAASQMSAAGTPMAAPKASLPWRSREIPPKAGVSLVYIYNIYIIHKHWIIFLENEIDKLIDSSLENSSLCHSKQVEGVIASKYGFY